MDWDERYRTGDLPWDTGSPDANLAEGLVSFSIEPCKTLELGCGTGTNAVWLAGKGFEVSAVDLSPLAIERATERARQAGVTVSFSVGDVLGEGVPPGPFGFLFDRGCFHSFDCPDVRRAFVDVAADRLSGSGLWLSLVGSTDGPERDVGPPRRTAVDIAAAVEPRFEILRLKSTVFDSDQDEPPRAWACLLRKR